MTSEDFSSIGTRLGLTLPAAYVRRLAVYPLTEPVEDLFDSAEEVIRENERLRSEGYFDCPWPRDFFVIGQSAAGDPFFMLPGTSDPRVFWADHEGGPPPDEAHLAEMEFSDTLDEYIAQTNETIAEMAQEMERRKNKKWWQFWI